jgi:hypothetical protein
VVDLAREPPHAGPVYNGAPMLAPRTWNVLVGAVLLLGLSCSSSSFPSSPAACTSSLGTTEGADLTLVGSGACATTLYLQLRVASGSPTAPTWNDAGSSLLHVAGTWQMNNGVATRRVTVSNPGAQPVTLVGLEWSTDAAGVGLPVDRLLHDGYQSWTYTGVESIPASIPDANGTASHGGDDENTLGEVPGVSWWWTALSDASAQGLVVGVDGGTVLKTYLAADGSGPVRLRIVQGVTGDAIVLQPGQSKTLDGLWLALGDVRDNLDKYAHAVAQRHPPAVPRRRALGGWGSWNEYYDTITAGALAQEAGFAASTLAPDSLTDLLLDDGYETHWGSWMASPAFGNSLQGVASSESAQGLRPAIWLAPFYVDTSDPMVAAHPDWFVHNTDGTLRTYDNDGPTSAALDVSSPDARAFVVQSVQQLAAWGYDTLKIDFLFAGALEGVRQQPLTSLESYALWMQTLRQAVPGVHLVGCGAPMLPSVGWVDSMRIGPDIAYSTDPEPHYTFLSAEARHVAMRASTDAWWSLDPDVVLLRGTNLTDAQAWTVVVFSALAGGNYLLGDGQQAGDLRRAFALEPAVRAIVRDGVAARAQDLVAGVDPKLFPSPLLAGNTPTTVPHVWKKTSADGAHGWLAVFGWDVQGYSASATLPAGAQEIVPPAAPGPTSSRPAGGAQSIAVDPYATRLFAW